MSYLVSVLGVVLFPLSAVFLLILCLVIPSSMECEVLGPPVIVSSFPEFVVYACVYAL